MPPFSEHEPFGSIGMLQAGVQVSDVTWYYNCHPLTVHRLRDRYQATGTVKYWRSSGWPKWRPAAKMATYVECIDDICINNIHSDWLLSVPDEN